MTRWHALGLRWGLPLLAVGAAALLGWSYRATATPGAHGEETWVAALVQRCNARMRQDTCGVMSAGVSTQPAARLFIAGVGEVDGEAFERLRSQGDAMCQEVAQQCRADRRGAACRIAQALYSEGGS